MTLYDVTVPLNDDLPTYPGDPGIEISNWLTLANGDAANVSLLHFGAHTGTHVDAPAHFLPGAAKSETMPLDVLLGKSLVVELSQTATVIDEEFVATHCPAGTERILFKTRNSRFWSESKSVFRRDFTYLSLPAAQRLVAQRIKLVGIDYLSIEQFGVERHETHFVLLRSGVVIVEGLNLIDVPPGNYELICLPLRIRGGHGDGAPARVVLRTID
jgi:arylformamidase